MAKLIATTCAAEQVHSNHRGSKSSMRWESARLYVGHLQVITWALFAYGSKSFGWYRTNRAGCLSRASVVERLDDVAVERSPPPWRPQRARDLDLEGSKLKKPSGAWFRSDLQLLWASLDSVRPFISLARILSDPTEMTGSPNFLTNPGSLNLIKSFSYVEIIHLSTGKKL